MSVQTKNQIQSRIKEIEKELANLEERYRVLNSQRKAEKGVIRNVRELKSQIENLKLEAEEEERRGNLSKVAETRYGKIPELIKKLEKEKQKLDSQKKTGSLIKEEVQPEDISEIVSKMTGIPIKKVAVSEKEKLLAIEEELHKRIVGQDEAVKLVSDAIKRARTGFSDKDKPIGSFVFLGTTGVGKTELARALAEYLFNDENTLLRIDMSEYMEAHSVSRLIGAPPGYVGYDEGGQLTEAVRRHPFSIVLLDEIEKAHPDVHNVLLQVMDNGRLTDSKGRTVNFKNTILVMTSNLGSSLIQERLGDAFKNQKDSRSLIASTKNEVFGLLQKQMRPEFLNRIDEIVLFLPLTRDQIKDIVDIQFRQVVKRADKQGIKLSLSDEARDWIAQLGYDPIYGARPLKRVIQRKVVNILSEKVLKDEIKEGDSILINLKNNSEFDFIKTK